MREEEERTFARPRGQAWGNEPQRAVLHAIAEDVARRSGHRVAVIEALRSDGNLEFVAIAGSPEGHERLMGEATPPLMIDRIAAAGTHIDGWVHLPAERIDDETRAWVGEYGHTPDVPGGEGPDAWDPEDLLFRLLTSGDGAVRAVLWLDEPDSGQRPTPGSIAAINAEVDVMLEAVVSIVERELYGEHVRMVTQARTAVHSVRPGLEVGEFMRELADAMVEAMPVDSVDVLLAGQRVPDLEPHTAFFAGHMREVWLRHGHLVVEQVDTWGVTDAAVPTPGTLRRLMQRRGLGSWLLVPIGMGEEYLGTMGLGRGPGGARWIDSEINAAAAVASDLAGVILDARLRESQRLLNAELRNVNDYRRDMVITLAHELRNPVSVLWTHLEMLGQLGMVFGPLNDSLAAMDRATRRIEDMVEALMALAAISDPDRIAATEAVDLSAVVWESSEFLAGVAGRAGVDLLTRVAPDQVVVGESASIERMVANLVSNAVKYTLSGGSVTVSLGPETRDGRPGVRLSCADTGIGIGEDDLDHVFTPFFRTGNPAARERPGTGLGLSIVERVVTWHDGAITVSSELGTGTTFVVWLPVGEPADPA